jgi:FeS assembly SUF system regulator
MFRISKMTDYAVLIVGELAKTKGRIMSAATLAEALRLQLPTVSKILKMLALAGLVSAVRGAEGGYFLARSATEITIADVVKGMEGQVAVTACCEKSGLCVIDTSCTLRNNWKAINHKLIAMLSQWTVADMLRPLSP